MPGGELKPGDLVGGRYLLVDRIGAGGMGTVFRARHTVSERIVALKVVHSHLVAGPETAERFKREASAAAKVRHPGLVEILDAGVDPDAGLLFLAMELLEGESLRERLVRRDPATDLLRIVRELCEPLGALHGAGLVHRDVKPENVFLTRRLDGVPRVVLLDLGLVRTAGMPGATGPGHGIGTPTYMAPEQFMSARDVTPAADVWSVGVILYEALAGRPPFGGETPQAVLVEVSTGRPIALADAAPGSDPALAALVDRCLSKDPAARPRDALELRAALTRCEGHSPERPAVGGPFPVRRPGHAPTRRLPDAPADPGAVTIPATSAPPPPARRPIAAIAIGLVTITVAAVAVGLLVGPGEDPPPGAASPPPAPRVPQRGPEESARSDWRGQPGAGEVMEEILAESPDGRAARGEQALADGRLDAAKGLFDSVVADETASDETALRAQMGLVGVETERSSQLAASFGQPTTASALRDAASAVTARMDLLHRMLDPIGVLRDGTVARDYTAATASGRPPPPLHPNARCATATAGRIFELHAGWLIGFVRPSPAGDDDALALMRRMFLHLARNSLISASEYYSSAARLPVTRACGVDPAARLPEVRARIAENDPPALSPEDARQLGVTP